MSGLFLSFLISYNQYMCNAFIRNYPKCASRKLGKLIVCLSLISPVPLLAFYANTEKYTGIVAVFSNFILRLTPSIFLVIYIVMSFGMLFGSIVWGLGIYAATRNNEKVKPLEEAIQVNFLIVSFMLCCPIILCLLWAGGLGLLNWLSFI